MRVVLAPYGSRGDVEPMLALGHSLRHRGHSVVLAGPPDSQALVEADGIPFHPVALPFSSFFEESRNELKVLYRAFQTIPTQFVAMEKLVAEADAVVGAMLQFAAPSLAEAYHVPYFYAVFSPCYLRSLEQPALSIPLRRPPKWLHRLTWFLQDSLFPVLGGALIRERRRRSLTSIASLYDYLARSGSLLAAVDPKLTPVPSDVLPVHITGFWRRRATGNLPAHVEEFLSTGPPPLYVGFGSVQPRMSSELMTIIATAASRAGVRVLFPEDTRTSAVAASRSCLPVPNIPHDLLFPRVRAVVHHGGAGTFASAAVAGRPQGIVAHLGDQYYHGFCVQALGLGPAPLHARTLTASKLAHMFAELSTTATYSANAAAIAPAIRLDGADQASAVIEETLARGKRSPEL